MLRRIKIENLRGIREGEIDGLTKLVVLVGPNGSGKSTVLEGAYIGGARHPAAAAGAVTKHRTHTWNGAQWLIRGGSEENAARVEVEWTNGTRVTRRIHWDSVLVVREANEKLSKHGAPGPYSAFRIYREVPPMPRTDEADAFAATAMAANNEYLPYDVEMDLELAPLRLIDPTGGQPLHDLFTQAKRSPWRDELLESTRSVIPDLEDIEILTEKSVPRLFLLFGNKSTPPVPVSLAGDGIHALLRMAFELSSPAGGTVLLEEPETHMHPRALSACAKAIVAAVRRGVQVIATTHSLELIDRLLAELTDEEVEDPSMMTLQKVRLQDGRLMSIEIPASDAEQARTTLSEDLR
ncbi:AAA family ATPase [Paraliomyxa miuraensis]|uniref:AAA family ATPase n=1 Tax=Paraliomyxa miuraensis TaxID=376150 RepID=UPI00225BD6FE|nr:AAA family ATPase [Paraliomyxa miuraensis]MCX4246068.1 AAA family ATPase [Paraliomyxa miuraensis]